VTILCVRAHRLVLIFLLLFGALTLASPVSAERSEEDPFLVSDVFPPRSVEILLADEPESVRLLDASGVEVPLTGEGFSFENGTLTVYPPRLPVGAYRIVHPGGEQEILVGEPPFVTLPDPSAARPFWHWLLLGAVAPGVVLLLLPRRRLLALPLLGLGLIGGVLLLTGSGDRVQVTKGDPCALASGASGCASDYVLGVFAAEGPASAASELRRLSGTEDSAWASICHEIAHDLGSLTFRTSMDHVGSVSAGFTDCSLGYVHGVLEAMGTYLDDDSFPAAAVETCLRVDELFLPQGGSVFGCHHGVGHAAMWRFNESLQPASAVCDLFEQPRQREECKVGAVMEWVYADQRAQVSGRDADAPLPRVESTLDLCAPPIGDLSEGCVEGALTSVGKSGVLDAAAWCDDNRVVLEACMRSLARRVVQIDLSEGGTYLVDPMSFCSAFGDGDARGLCAMQVGYMHLFLSRSRSTAKTVCESFPSELVSRCKEGNEQVLEYAEAIGDGSFNFRD